MQMELKKKVDNFQEVWARSLVHPDLAKVLNFPGYCQGNSCKFTGEGGCELSGKISLCIVVSRKQTSHKVEWRTSFILAITADTFYDNRKRFRTHLTLGQQETTCRIGSQKQNEISRDGVLDTHAKTTGKFSGYTGR